MERALGLAERGRGLVSPNPLVGAVVVRDGRIVGEGHHRGPGTAHAEVAAIAAAGEAARGSTLYSTLEPCDHVGHTGPCTTAIIEGGIARVVSATADPNPVVYGRGHARLRAAGVEVETGVLRADAERLNEAYAKHIRTGLPFVTWKMAASLDGKVAARDGTSRWITGEAARRDVHRLRRRPVAHRSRSGVRRTAARPRARRRARARSRGRRPLRRRGADPRRDDEPGAARAPRRLAAGRRGC